LSRSPVDRASRSKRTTSSASSAPSAAHVVVDIDAIAAMCVDYDKIDHRTRVQRYLAAEEQVATRYPDDDEAQIAITPASLTI
jgi:hypothetical protein